MTKRTRTYKYRIADAGHDDNMATLTTTDCWLKRQWLRLWYAAWMILVRRAALDAIFPRQTTITRNHIPESGYTCKLRDGFIDMQMWRLRYPDGKAEFHSARVPCADPTPDVRRVKLHLRAKAIADTPEVQQTFDAWLNSHMIVQPDFVTYSDNPIEELNASVRYGTASSVRKARWSWLRSFEDWANDRQPIPSIATEDV